MRYPILCYNGQFRRGADGAPLTYMLHRYVTAIIGAKISVSDYKNETVDYVRGTNELKIINMLLENEKLIFSSDDLLGLVPYHARNIKSSAAVKTALNL